MHDRQMRDLEELRSLLDEAARDLTNAEMADREYWNARKWQEAINPHLGGDDRKVSLDEAEKWRKLVDARIDALHLALATQERVAMRLGTESEVRERFYDAARALRRLMEVPVDAEDGDERRAAHAGELAEGRTAFVLAAQRLIGSQLPE